jgi:hypothetical protein
MATEMSNLANGTDITALAASKLTGALPAIDGSALTNLPASGMPSGTKVAFFQASAPTGWTQDTTNTDAILRVVSGTGGGTGGTAAVSSPAHSLSAGAHTLSTAEMPSHTHGITVSTDQSTGGIYKRGSTSNDLSTAYTDSSGGSSSHSHSLSGAITTPKYVDMIVCSKD